MKKYVKPFIEDEFIEIEDICTPSNMEEEETSEVIEP